MFEYTHEVRGFNKHEEKDDGTTWGIFPNKSIAEIMRNKLADMLGSTKTSFYVKELV